MRFITDRGCSHELVRHRLISVTQSSTRYCNYSQDKFGNEITVVRPVDLAVEDNAYLPWVLAMQYAEQAYLGMLKCGAPAQLARSVLPNSLQTELIVTANLREWLTILRLRTASNAHPQMRALMLQAQGLFAEAIPLLYAHLDTETHGGA
jgi:thymidylate synthase (FAD)